jgi:hypothetical protein
MCSDFFQCVMMLVAIQGGQATQLTAASIGHIVIAKNSGYVQHLMLRDQ